MAGPATSLLNNRQTFLLGATALSGNETAASLRIYPLHRDRTAPNVGHSAALIHILLIACSQLDAALHWHVMTAFPPT
ncbi:hypothetical protein K461DRAFT_92003 [Myriangium duriaei CBS 260.36]|uniref:Uncharacterized protein n=1 Tax=Myriangium duriaei CBS 260.36 TaxID=1168546 RepID=A0A9P4J6B0_9PEZI|nr:hypothetical protein K461DRAFT_92003 [Myriangium duriaei CBS 260.36]